VFHLIIEAVEHINPPVKNGDTWSRIQRRPLICVQPYSTPVDRRSTPPEFRSVKQNALGARQKVLKDVRNLVDRSIVDRLSTRLVALEGSRFQHVFDGTRDRLEI
jgi:hypothetical protein